jgi:predicted nuclease of predicted toxin-antitoxin system
VTQGEATTLWLDAQLSPGLAAWITRSFDSLTAHSVRAVGLRDAEDEQIFLAAREAGAVLITKDGDFARLLEVLGPPPPVIWIRLGNSSNARMREVLSRHLRPALQLLAASDMLVEIAEL